MSDKSSTGGIGFCGMLTIVFIVMKLLGKINWSWWWVLAPIWLPILVGIGIVLFVLLLSILVVVIKK